MGDFVVMVKRPTRFIKVKDFGMNVEEFANCATNISHYSLLISDNYICMEMGGRRTKGSARPSFSRQENACSVYYRQVPYPTGSKETKYKTRDRSLNEMWRRLLTIVFHDRKYGDFVPRQYQM